MKRSSLLSTLVTAFLLLAATSSHAQKPFRILGPDTVNYGLVPGGAYVYTPIEIENLTGDTITIYDAGDITFESTAYTTLLDEMLIIDNGDTDSAANAKMSIPPYETKQFITVSLFDDDEFETTATSTLAKTYDWEDSSLTQYWITGQATYTGMGPYWDDFNQEYTLYPNQSIGAPVMYYGPDALGPATYHFSNLTTEPIVVTDISLWRNMGIDITNISHGTPPFTLGVNEELTVEVSYVDESAVPIDHLIVQTRAPLDLKKYMLMDPSQFADVKEGVPTSTKINAVIYPNPAAESVKLSVDGAQHMSVRIYDIQGVKVFEGTANGSLNWDRTNTAGEKQPAGAYQVMIDGTDSIGKPISATGQLILQ
jgi:hypothetical protein